MNFITLVAKPVIHFNCIAIAKMLPLSAMESPVLWDLLRWLWLQRNLQLIPSIKRKCRFRIIKRHLRGRYQTQIHLFSQKIVKLIICPSVVMDNASSSCGPKRLMKNKLIWGIISPLSSRPKKKKNCKCQIVVIPECQFLLESNLNLQQHWTISFCLKCKRNITRFGVATNSNGKGHIIPIQLHPHFFPLFCPR